MARDINGIIYPVNMNNFKLLLKRKKPMYVKFLIHKKSKNPTRLLKGDTLFLYLSHKDKSIIGYSKIQNISFLTPIEIQNNYIGRIQMEPQEYTVYIKGRLDKPLISLELSKIVELKTPIIIDYPITMAGKYVYGNTINNLIQKI